MNDGWDHRRRKILTGLENLDALQGVEIGALDHPLVRKSEGSIIYVDYTNTDELRSRYASFPDHDVTQIVDVDAVWGDNTLSEAIGNNLHVDYVVASHVIEHVPDMITWLNEIEAILKPGGTLHLAVPDRRFTFDIRRQNSIITDFIHAYAVRARRPMARQILDCDLHFLATDAVETWRGGVVEAKPFDRAKLDHALEVLKEVERSSVYLDTHCWTFTPQSFIQIFEQLSALDLIKFSCAAFIPTERDDLEFVAVLRRNQDARANAESWCGVSENLRAL